VSHSRKEIVSGMKRLSQSCVTDWQILPLDSSIRIHIDRINYSEVMNMTDHGFKCKLCEAKFHREDELQKHIKETHPEAAMEM
jgi:hypothetical protein